MKVGVFGAGHVGLPTAASIAHLGHVVVLYDSDADRIATLEKGGVPFFEPGLEELVRAGVDQGRLIFSSSPEPAVADARIVFICVGTPPRASGEADLAAMERAAELVAGAATDDVIVVQKSTVPTGTASTLMEHMQRHNPDVRFDVVSNPEFLREGSAVEDSLRPPRILVGGDSEGSLLVLRELYEPLIRGGSEWIQTDLVTAELSKHAANAFLAMKVSYANALARISELAGADILAVREAIGSDPRIGRDFLEAGLGYGGYCLPKDVAAFEMRASRLGYDFGLLREVARINEEALTTVFSKVEQELRILEDKRIVVLGLAFKPGTDDTRFSPAIELARRLLDAGAQVVGFDPEAATNAKRDLPRLEIAADIYEALEGAHLAVIATGWPEIAQMDLERASSVMGGPIVIDGRNLFSRSEMADAGFTYIPTGRPPVRSPHPEEGNKESEEHD